MQSVISAGRTLVVSPHLDDAVLSCGAFLAACPGATVLTVFTGLPEDAGMLTDYDRQCGFTSAGQAMHTRCDEDRRALSVLGVDHLHLGALDSQYAPLPEVDTLSRRLSLTLRQGEWETVIMPMGLFHCDHERVADACLQVVRDAAGSSTPQWVLYEDVPYRRRLGVMQQRLAHLTQQRWLMAPVALEQQADVPCEGDAARARKREALACYASQLVTLGLLHGGDQDAPERFWSLVAQ